MHTVTRESQDVVVVFVVTASIVSNGVSYVTILIASTDIPHSGQLNITTSTLPSIPPWLKSEKIEYGVYPSSREFFSSVSS